MSVCERVQVCVYVRRDKIGDKEDEKVTKRRQGGVTCCGVKINQTEQSYTCNDYTSFSCDASVKHTVVLLFSISLVS